MKFHARDYLNNHDDEDAWQEVEAYDAEEVAELYMDENFSYVDDAKGPFEVQVKSPDGSISIWSVEIEYEPKFSASRMVTFVINGREIATAYRNYSYPQLLWLAFPNTRGDEVMTVTYKGAAKPATDGTLVDGQHLTVKDGTVITVEAHESASGASS